jgi:hypothetical protein
MGSCLTIITQNMILDLLNGGYPINNAAFATPLYSNNDMCVTWCHNMTSKGNRLIKLKKNVTRKWAEDGAITGYHISSKCNPSDIFTEEMHGSASFQRLHDAFMCPASTFFKGLYLTTLPILDSTTSDPVTIAQMAHYVPPTKMGTLKVLLSNPLFHTPAALSCLPNAGSHILLHVSVFSGTL